MKILQMFCGKRDVRTVLVLYKYSPYFRDFVGICFNLILMWTHAEFVKIHPFPDGNGRTSRLIMNYQLMANKFSPVSIAKEKRLEYFNTLEAYAVEGKLAPFAEMVAELVEQQLDCYLSMIMITEDKKWIPLIGETGYGE